MKRRFIVIKLKEVIIGVTIFLSFILILPVVLIRGGDSNGQAIGEELNMDKERIINDKSTDESVSAQAAAKIYSDKLDVYITSKKIIEKMDFEDYIKGVVAAEMPANFNIEALKAQAIAARTYAMGKCVNKCPKSQGADICDTTHCQAYIDKDSRIKNWGKNGETYWEKISKAVDDTAGQVMFYNGSMVMNAKYFAISGGKTENSIDVFGEDEPYLKSVSSPGEERASKYKTTVTVPIDTFINKINSSYKNASLSKEGIASIKISERTEGGSVKNIKVGNVNLKGSDFRTLFKLNSSNFTLTSDGNNMIIVCVGYGHGVGMSQWGAAVMADGGSSCSDIIKHYYKGVEIKSIK